MVENHQEDSRLTIVAFAWRLLCAPIRWLGVGLAKLFNALSEPTLSDLLPPVAPYSAVAGDDALLPAARGERLFLDVWRVPPAYREAMVMVAKAAAEMPSELFAHGRVHFVLSRLCPDPCGSVTVERLRAALPDVSVTFLNQILRDLEGWEDVYLLPATDEDNARALALGISDMFRGSLVRVQLRTRP